MREKQIASLFCNIQSDDNRHFRIFEILKIKYYASYILADCLQLDIGIKGFKDIIDVGFGLEKSLKYCLKRRGDLVNFIFDGLPFLNALKSLMMSYWLLNIAKENIRIKRQLLKHLGIRGKNITLRIAYP